MPVKNAETHLGECLESLRTQKFRGFEVVAVNHGSKDASARTLEAEAGRDSRLRIFESRAPSLPEALNEGLAACRGEIIARMDADDLCHPLRFERQLRLLEQRPELGLVGAGVEFFGDEAISEGLRLYQSWINALEQPEDIVREIFIECPIPHPTWMGRRKIFHDLGYLDDGLPEDHHFILRAAEAGILMAKVPGEALLRWRDHSLRHSRLHERYRRPAFMRLKAKFLKRWICGDRPCILWGAGDRGRLLARMLLEEGARIDAVVAWTPGRDLPNSVHGIRVVGTEALPEGLPGPLIVCVGTPGVRAEVRDWMKTKVWVEGKDYWFAS